MTRSMNGRTVFITGANGGLGEQFVAQALARGATKVYAAARTPRQWPDARVVAVPLDLVDPDSAVAAASAAWDVDLLINNAGIAPVGDSISGPEADLRRVFETNFFGTLRVANAFGPVLAANGGGALLNVLSLAAWTSVPTGYAASKAAMWSATNALRLQLEPQGTQVVSLLVGMIDTPMAARWDVPKVTPESVVTQAYDGIEAGLLEILADDGTRFVKSRLSQSAEEFYPWVHAQLAGFVA
jgi:NAD(P)-dependent dehydrogenase (short-subunit alcohol dehydrogenase family)